MKVRREVDEFVNLTDSKSPQMQAITFYSIFHTYTCVIYMLLSEDQGAQPEDRAAQKAAQLFAKLKEALAEARGFVCSVLALPDAALPYIPPRAFADFVGFMQRHRAEEAAVLKATPRPLRRFFAAAFDLPELRVLRDTMLDSFDVAALKQTGLTVRGWWEVRRLCPRDPRNAAHVDHHLAYASLRQPPRNLALALACSLHVLCASASAHDEPHQSHARAPGPDG